MLALSVFMVAVAEAIGQTSINLSRVQHNWWWMGLALLAYAAVAFGLYMSYAYKGVGIVNALWSGLSVLIMVVIGLLVFREEISRVEWLGVVLILCGILILSLQ
jgi:small multidrug resistance pump